MTAQPATSTLTPPQARTRPWRAVGELLGERVFTDGSGRLAIEREFHYLVLMTEQELRTWWHGTRPTESGAPSC